MNAAIIISWSEPIPGREQKALDYGVEVSEYWGKLAADAKCSEPEWFFYDNGHGLWIVKGERDMLLSLYTSPESRRFITKGRLLLQDFTADFTLTGPAAESSLLEFAEIGHELGVIS